MEQQELFSLLEERATLNGSLAISHKVKVLSLHDSEIILLDIYSNELKIYHYTKAAAHECL